MKKLILSIIFALCLLLPVQAMAAETLDQLEAKAKANRDAYQKAKEQKALSEQEKAEATKQKEQVQADIKQITEDIKKAQDEITDLSKQIDIKDKEIKNNYDLYTIINYFGKIKYQSNGQTNYFKKLTKVNPKKASLSNSIYVSIPKEVLNSDKVSFIIDIRDKSYEYVIK